MCVKTSTTLFVGSVVAAYLWQARQTRQHVHRQSGAASARFFPAC